MIFISFSVNKFHKSSSASSKFVKVIKFLWRGKIWGMETFYLMLFIMGPSKAWLELNLKTKLNRTSLGKTSYPISNNNILRNTMVLSPSSQEDRGSYWNVQTRLLICQVRGTLNKLPVLCDAPCRVTPDGSTLNISRALTSDTGKYTCVATNPAGEEDRIFNLNVYGEFCQMWNPSLLHNPILGSVPKGEPRGECLSAVESCLHVFPIACAADITQDALSMTKGLKLLVNVFWDKQELIPLVDFIIEGFCL